VEWWRDRYHYWRSMGYRQIVFRISNANSTPSVSAREKKASLVDATIIIAKLSLIRIAFKNVRAPNACMASSGGTVNCWKEKT
jgi:hypothetical protein